MCCVDATFPPYDHWPRRQWIIGKDEGARPEGERGARAPWATELASGRAPLVLLQTLRELDQAIDSPTEKQWSCGDAIARLRAFVWKAFSENAIRPRAN